MCADFQYGTGIWYEIARYPNEFESTNCRKFDFLPEGDKLKTRIFYSVHMAEDSPNHLSVLLGMEPDVGNKGEMHLELSMGSMY